MTSGSNFAIWQELSSHLQKLTQVLRSVTAAARFIRYNALVLISLVAALQQLPISSAHVGANPRSSVQRYEEDYGNQDGSISNPVVTSEVAKGRSFYFDAIIFPETILPFSSTKKSGSKGTNQQQSSKFDIKCVTVDGKTGICRSILACESNANFLSLFTQRVVGCELQDNGDIELICCPQWVGTPTAKISSSTPKGHSKPAQAATPSSVPTSALNNELGVNKNNGVESLQPPPSTSGELSTPPQDIFKTDEAQEVCGIFDSSRLGTKGKGIQSNGGVLWPWIVSIGRRHEDGSINFRCLGSLITREFILSTAQCVQRSPNVVLVGRAYLGFVSAIESLQFAEAIKDLSSVEYHQRYKQPYVYQNIGIARLKNAIHVTEERIPACFPFLAGVLDIIPFSGVVAKTIGFDTSKSVKDIQFGIEEYKILNKTQCSKTIDAHKLQTRGRFPVGIKSDHMCGLIENPSKLCQAPGSPLVIFDSASDSHVIIGISTGDPTCDEMKRQVVTFTRINVFSTWVRDRVGKLPDPPPCYVN